MKCSVSVFAVVLVVLLFAAVVHAQSTQVITGTQVRLSLVNGLSTNVAHDGDPFMAIVAEPVFMGSQLVLPAGAKVHGTVTSVARPRMFSMFRGGASMNLVFNSIEIESRIFPAKMSILSIYSSSTEAGKRRKDVKTVEGVVIEQKHSITSDIEDVGIGTTGGTAVGAIFSHVMRGTVFGLVGGAAYVVAKKGKDVELPAQTGMLVRMDSAVSLPGSLMRNTAYTSSDR
jgi:hypothetical protein